LSIILNVLHGTQTGYILDLVTPTVNCREQVWNGCNWGGIV